MKIGEKEILILRDTDRIPKYSNTMETFDEIFFITTRPSGQSVKDVKTLSRQSDRRLHTCMLMPVNEREIPNELAESIAKYYLES